MILTRDNIEEWKNFFNTKVMAQGWPDEDYCESRTNEEWLAIYEGESSDSILWAEEEYWDD